MNNLEELKQELKKLENKINELENKKTEEDNKYKRKRIKKNEYYYYLSHTGGGKAYRYTEMYDDTDNFLYNIGNYFKNEEQAENYKERLLIEQELKDIAMELNKGEEIDWNDNNKIKYYLQYYFGDNKILNDSKYSSKAQGVIYCLDKKFKDTAIERIGEERLTKYLKGELD
jgi:hypothetical protein